MAGFTRQRLILIVLALAALVFAYLVMRPEPRHPPSQVSAAPVEGVDSAADARRALFGAFVLAEHWLILSDSYARSGDRDGAIQTIRSGLKAHPKDSELWTGLGYALAGQAGRLTPDAQAAFDKAAGLAPASPGPPYFRGRALLDAGDRMGALAAWKAILADAPAKVSWRPFMEQEIARAGGTTVPPTAGDTSR